MVVVPPQIHATRPAPAPTTGLSSRRIAALSIAGGGLAAGIVSGVLFGVAQGERSDLDAALANRDADGHIIGSTPESNAALLSGIESKKTVAAILGGVGVASLGVAGWLWLTDQPQAAQMPQVSVSPLPGGAYLQIGWAR